MAERNPWILTKPEIDEEPHFYNRVTHERTFEPPIDLTDDQIRKLPWGSRYWTEWLLRQRVEKQEKSIKRNLGEYIESSADFPRSLYTKLATKPKIEAFLAKTELWDGTRWKVPENVRERSSLYSPLSDIISAIIQNFGPAQMDQHRRVVQTHKMRLIHHREKANFSSPSLAIQAAGPSFEPPTSKNGVGYSNIAACFQVALSSHIDTVDYLVTTLGISAREIFLRQPNRRFVRSLIITEEDVYLVHFDRSGVMYTPAVNIHDEPHVFVRLVLGLSSLNERTLGLDDSIQWTIKNGKKDKGTLKTVEGNRKVVYEIIGDGAYWQADRISGRGTVCWKVRHPVTGDILLVKDAWRYLGHDEDLTESQYLEKVTDVRGVAQMVSFEISRGNTSDKEFRGDLDAELFHSLVATRVVMHSYGQAITKFTSVPQVLNALHDAILGHKGLVSRGILHRDISANNVLLGNPDAEDGDRGILIDLDMACSSEARPGNYIVGTHMYQSANILIAWRDGETPQHDYLDDLESFFYLLCYLLVQCEGEGGVKPHVHPTILEWDNKEDDGRVAIRSKTEFLTDSQDPPVPLDTHIDDTWGAPCRKLLNRYKRFVADIYNRKRCLVLLSGSYHKAFTSLYASREEHYNTVLKFINKAVVEWDDLNRTPEPTPSCTPDSTPLTSPFSSPAKPVQLRPQPTKGRLPLGDLRANVAAAGIRGGKRELGVEDRFEEQPSPKRLRSGRLRRF